MRPLSALLKRILKPGPRRANRTGRDVHVAAFGKHPGWDDHIDDLGLDTDRLIQVKRLLYMEGVRENIDSGTWDELGPDEQLAAFHHLFVWRNGDGDVVVGRLWSSRDGKGRDRYPMIVCAHCRGAAWSWIVSDVLPALERLEADCRATESAADVRALVSSARAALQERMARLPSEPVPPQGSIAAAAELAVHPALGPDHVGFSRVCYAIFNDMTAYRRAGSDSTSARTRSVLIRPQHLRVPACDEAPVSSMTRWLEFLMSQIDARVPVLLLNPIDEPWLDLVVGDATPAQVFLLRAGLGKAPLTSDIPYALDDSFRHELADVLDEAQAAQKERRRAGASKVDEVAAAERSSDSG